jgi:microcystin degradation protein MlrC
MRNYLKTSILLFFLIIFLTAGTGLSQNRSIKILYGGISHESNTFIPYMTKKEDFNQIRDIEEKEITRTLNNYYKEKNVEFIFTLLARTGPYGVVTKEAYESFRDEILEGCRSAGKLDGIMLQMHGALHAEGYEDAQLDFIRSLRAIVGNDIIISASFDLHGNMSKEFVSELNILTAFRTAPHVDASETIERAVDLLYQAIQKNQHPVIAHINIPVLIPGEKGITAVEPLKSLYEYLPAISKKEGLLDASIFVGMPWTDVYRAGMSVQVVAEDEDYLAQAQKEAQHLAEQIWAKREELKFDVPTDDIDGAIRTAKEAPESTVFITDSGDNTTAGAAGDGTLVMEKLMELGVRDAVVAGIVDPQAVAECEKVGVGGIINMEIGGKLDTVFSKPLHIKGKVMKISENCPVLDPERKPAVVDVNGILLVLLNQRRSFTAPEDFTEVDIDPLKHKIVIVKLGYLFQGLRDIAPRTIMALTPGFANQTIENLHYNNVRRPIYPLDPEMSWNVEY